MNIDLARIVEAALNGVAQLSIIQLVTATLCAFLLLVPWWVNRSMKLLLCELQEFRKDSIRSFEISVKTLAEVQIAQAEILGAVQSTHESVLCSTTQSPGCSLEEASSIRELREKIHASSATQTETTSPDQQSDTEQCKADIRPS